jgi:2-C-methyl-D-erythritol 4-phosphate cytidylyltransferase
VTQVSDTVKFIRNNLVESTANRDRVVFAQTPQIFLVKILRDAYAKAGQDGFAATDDAALVENLGWRVSVVPGERDNIKITTLVDLFWAEKILEGVTNK